MEPLIVARVVDEAAAWEEKLALHMQIPEAPDGHAVSAGRWVELERRKAGTGGLRCYVIEHKGGLCAAIATLNVGPLLRIKNLVVHPAWRRRGVARAVVRHFVRSALTAGQAAGCLALAGSIGETLYPQCGLRPAVAVTEWSRRLVRISAVDGVDRD